MARIVRVTTQDIRFPTSQELDGSDAVNVDPDYSAAYVVLEADDGQQGHAFVFTAGRGTDVMVDAIDAYGRLLVGADLDALVGDLGEASRRLVHDSQMRWLGPEKGVSHMACGALINALWDARCRRDDLPLWRLLSTMSAEELADVVDFTHLTDVLDRSRALDILTAGRQGSAERVADLERTGYPAYTTTPGWLGYSDEKLLALTRQAVQDGFSQVKLKVGRNLEEDRRRLGLVRREFPDLKLAVDANQAWEIDQAVDWIGALAEFDLAWVEEPTSTDDILGNAAIRKVVSPIRIAAGEMVHNRIMFKQLLRAEAIDVVQLDATRVGGVNENIAIVLLAQCFGVPVCPHAGGVGLCELVQHFAFFDYTSVSATQEERFIEYVDHLHEHFAEPVRIDHGRYLVPGRPGIGAEMLDDSRTRWGYPAGAAWLEVTK